MPTKLSDKAEERSSFTIRASFYEKLPDGTKNSVVPNSGLKWSLRDKDGNPINSRTDVSISPAAYVDIVLSGDDLAVPGNYPVKRYLTVEGTYNGVAGNNLPIVNEVIFQIYNLVGKP